DDAAAVLHERYGTDGAQHEGAHVEGEGAVEIARVEVEDALESARRRVGDEEVEPAVLPADMLEERVDLRRLLEIGAEDADARPERLDLGQRAVRRLLVALVVENQRGALARERQRQGLADAA